MKPFGNKVAVDQVKTEEKTPAGIIMANADNAPIKKGVVTEAGFGKHTVMGQLVPVPIPVGATIWYYQQSVTKIAEDGVDHLFVDVDQILAWA